MAQNFDLKTKFETTCCKMAEQCGFCLTTESKTNFADLKNLQFEDGPNIYDFPLILNDVVPGLLFVSSFCFFFKFGIIQKEFFSVQQRTDLRAVLHDYHDILLTEAGYSIEQ